MSRTGNTQNVVTTRSVRIASNLSGKEGYAVGFTDDNTVALLEAATSIPFILIEGIDGSSEAGTGTILLTGSYPVKLGGSVAQGDKLTATTGGVWITTVTDKNNFGAIATADGASGDRLEAIASVGMISAT
jgi:hypothetical protein